MGPIWSVGAASDETSASDARHQAGEKFHSAVWTTGWVCVCVRRDHSSTERIHTKLTANCQLPVSGCYTTAYSQQILFFVHFFLSFLCAAVVLQRSFSHLTITKCRFFRMFRPVFRVGSERFGFSAVDRHASHRHQHRMHFAIQRVVVGSTIINSAFIKLVLLFIFIWRCLR